MNPIKRESLRFTIAASIICACFAVAPYGPSGCAGGKWATGSASTDAALTAATSVLATQAVNAANQVAQGNDAKKALVQATGDAVRSLEGVAITAVQPVITERLLKWVPKNPEWQAYAHNIGGIISTYVVNHQSEPGVLKSALEAVAVTLNTY